MKDAQNYKELNKDAWNQKTESHVASDFYNMEAFMSGQSSLKEIELSMLGDVSKKSIMHLQCHFGQDSMSLSRMGAQVTAVDLSDKAIRKAKDIAKELDLDTQFICSDIYDFGDKHEEQYDIVFTSYGVIGWLPDLDKWAKIIAKLLKPGGRLVFVEFHPIMWMFDEDFKKIEYDYFISDAIVETLEGTYADTSAPISTKEVTWNHSLSEVMNSLINNGIRIDKMDEYDYSPYNCFKNMKEVEQGKYLIKQIERRIPMVYSVLGFREG